MLCRRTIASVSHSLSFSLILTSRFSFNVSLMYIIPFCYIFFFLLLMDRKEGRRGNTVVDGWKHSCWWSFFKVKTDRIFAENCTGRNSVVERRRSSRKFITFHAFRVLKGNILCRKKLTNIKNSVLLARFIGYLKIWSEDLLLRDFLYSPILQLTLMM